MRCGGVFSATTRPRISRLRLVGAGVSRVGPHDLADALQRGFFVCPPHDSCIEDSRSRSPARRLAGQGGASVPPTAINASGPATGSIRVRGPRSFRRILVHMTFPFSESSFSYNDREQSPVLCPLRKTPPSQEWAGSLAMPVRRPLPCGRLSGEAPGVFITIFAADPVRVAIQQLVPRYLDRCCQWLPEHGTSIECQPPKQSSGYSILVGPVRARVPGADVRVMGKP